MVSESIADSINLRSERDRRVIVTPTSSNDTEYIVFWCPKYLRPIDKIWKPERRFGNDRRGCEHLGDTEALFENSRNNDGSLDGEEICTECDSRWPIKVDINGARID